MSQVSSQQKQETMLTLSQIDAVNKQPFPNATIEDTAFFESDAELKEYGALSGGDIDFSDAMLELE
jgi:hypothetical protein